jgi:hypothetical protein
MTFGVRGHELGFRARIVERLLAGIELEINALLDGSTEALPAGMALAAIVMDWEGVRFHVSIRVVAKLTLGVALVFDLVLVFLVATIALGVVRLGLARTTTVLALLDGATLGVDVVQLAIYGSQSVQASRAGQWDSIPPWVQPLTRWPLMQDEQAHFSPSITGIPWKSRPDAVVAGGSRAVERLRAEEQWK